MSKNRVIVVPEDEFFAKRLALEHIIFINKNLGNPKLKNVRYAAPYILDKNNRGVHRLYHIIEVTHDENSTILKLGNSFLLKETWDKMKQFQKFQYENLDDFNLIEIKKGLLMDYDL